MAVTFVNATGANSGGSASSLSYSLTVPSGGPPLLVGVGGYNTAAERTVSTDVWNGASLSRIDAEATKAFSGTDFWNFSLWKLNSPTPATGNNVITPTANIDLSGISFCVSGAASGTYYRGSPIMMEFEGDDMPAYDIADAVLNDPIMFMMFCSTEPDSALTGSGTATSIVEQNRTTFTTGYQRAYSLVANGAAPDLSLSFNGYGFGGAIGLAIIDGSPSISSVTPSSVWDGKTGNVIAGSSFEASQGSGEVVISPIDDVDGETSVQATRIGTADLNSLVATSTGTITIPAAAVSGSLLVLHFTSRDHTSGGAQPTVTDNDTGGDAWAQKTFSTDKKAQMWYKRATSGTASKTITIAGASGSLSAVLSVYTEAFPTGDPFTNLALENNSTGDETHATITPTNANSYVVLAIYNVNNDNAVTSPSTATFGSLTDFNEHLSTGGSDSACAVAGKAGAPASATGNFTWAQTNGAAYTHAYAIRSRTPAGAPVTQTVTSWADTSITFTAERDTLALGSAFLFVTNNAGASNASGFSVTLVDVPAGGSGSGALTIPAAALGAGVTIERSASAAFALPAAGLASSATIVRSASGAVIVPPTVLAAAGGVIQDAEGALGMPSFALAADADVVRQVSGAATVASLALAGQSAIDRSVAGTITITGLTLAAATTTERFASGILQTSALSLAASLERAIGASGDVDLSALGLSSAADVSRMAAGALTVSPLSLLATFGSDRISSGALDLAPMVLSSAATTARSVSGVSAVASITLEASVSRQVETSGAFNLPAPTLISVLSIVRFADGTFALSVPILAGLASGEELTATAVLTVPAIVLDADALVSRTASGALVLVAPVLQGDAVRAINVQGVLILQAPNLSTQTAIARVAFGALDVPEAVLAVNAFVGTLQPVLLTVATVQSLTPIRGVQELTPSRSVDRLTPIRGVQPL